MTVSEEIEQLKKEKNAVILAHYYTRPEVQKIADYVGDSFYLSKIAVDLKEDTIVSCGVSFMGESTKILNPDKTVLMPDPGADCAMAHMADVKSIQKVRAEYDDLAVVCYINSTAELKQYSDVCVTSANAVHIVRNLPNKNIYFIPDRNLAHFVARQVPEKHFIYNEGYCPIHENILTSEIQKAREEHPDAKVLTHPECRQEVLAMSDYIGSTSQIIRYAGECDDQEFIICTENGVCYELQCRYPEKQFYFIDPEPICTDMKKITLEKICHVLKTGENEVKMTPEEAARAKFPLENMLRLAAEPEKKEQPSRILNPDAVIAGTGAAGLFCALSLPRDWNILMITKADAESSDSFLAQGGICVLRSEEDYANYFEDTMKAGHYENRKESVDIMIRSSQDVIRRLIGYGVEFARSGGQETGDGHTEAFLRDYAFTREGAHSRPRILFHEDVTGKEITSKLLARVKELDNVEIMEYVTMTDIIEKEGKDGPYCAGLVAEDQDGKILLIQAENTILATGGIGGVYQHSTNFPHITGDALEIAKRHGIRLEHLDYVQIHPTTLYSRKPGRRFLISESVRGEGALLLDKDGNRFVDELLPRDVVTAAIRKQMKKDGTDHVWLSMIPIGKEKILKHFPNIYQHCLEEGYDVTKEWIPVVPAQHYFMGGIWVDKDSSTSLPHLYAAGETSCNGVHGKNRLASNSLLESMVFAGRAAEKMIMEHEEQQV